MSRKQHSDVMAKSDCERLRENCASNNDRINLALWGEDGRGGIVKDIQDIKAQLGAYGGALKQFAVPIAVSIIVAVLVRFL